MSKLKGHEPTRTHEDAADPVADGPAATKSDAADPEHERGDAPGAPADVMDFTDFRQLAAAERRARERISKLQAVTAALSEAILPSDVARVVAHEMAAVLGASQAALAVPTADRAQLTLLGTSGLPETTEARYATFSVDADFPIAAAFRSGQSRWIASREELLRQHPGLPTAGESRAESLACVPLAVKGVPLGAVGFGYLEAHDFDAAERALIEDLARQAALALERARLRELERQARDRATFMAEASRVLATSLDVQATLTEIAHLAVPAMADWSSVELAEGGGAGKSKRVAVVHIDPEKVALAHRLNEQYPPDPDAPHGTPQVLRSGISELYETIPDELLVQSAMDAEHLRIARELGLKSAMTVAIRFQDRILGTISFVAAESGRRYTRSDLEMAEELGRRAGLALENARLFEAERMAREGAERLAERLTLLHRVSGALSAALTTQAVAQAMALHAARAVSCQSGGVWVLSESEGSIDLLESFGPLATRVDRHRRIPLDSAMPLPLLAAIRSGDALWFESAAELAAAYPEMVAALDGAPGAAAAVLPLRIEHRTLGVLTFDFDQPRQFPEEVRAYLRLLAQHAAQALERARLYEAERMARASEAVARRQAEAASQAREEILAVVSHDLRNPLNAILMSATSLRGLQLTDRQAPRVHASAERIERAAERMARLIGDLVDFASIQSGQLAIKKAATPISEIIDATIEMFSGAADERGLTLDRQLDGELDPVDCDRDRIIQALANLISNAIKVMSPGGCVTVGVERRDAEVVFFVRDTGPGIGADELPRVFDRYWRSKKVAYKGSGLGLTIARGIIDAHRGRIWVESALGVGSTFYVGLPAAPAAGR
ncbi:MAG TPA: GAF domain-containing protein [Haliangium sp.]|nr:GAF domain-containing protein [Haliangium sp.]